MNLKGGHEPVVVEKSRRKFLRLAALGGGASLLAVSAWLLEARAAGATNVLLLSRMDFRLMDDIKRSRSRRQRNARSGRLHPRSGFRCGVGYADRRQSRCVFQRRRTSARAQRFQRSWQDRIAGLLKVNFFRCLFTARGIRVIDYGSEMGFNRYASLLDLENGQLRFPG